MTIAELKEFVNALPDDMDLWGAYRESRWVRHPITDIELVTLRSTGEEVALIIHS